MAEDCMRAKDLVGEDTGFCGDLSQQSAVTCLMTFLESCVM